MEESNIILFLGRFHPLLVHLPIGFLLFAAVIEITERFKITKGLKNAVPFSLLLGTLSAVAASILGLMLATSGDYNHEALDNHKWAGITTTFIALFAYLLSLDLSIFKAIKQKLYLVLVTIMVVGLSVTGHMGGNLTHGEDYLTHYMPFKKQKEDPLKRPEVTDIAQAEYFADVVHPIIKAKCFSCHNASKMKGQLSFESIETYVKGGKHGNTIVPGDAASSEIMVRVNLEESDKLFMPPKGKTPLTDEEKGIIQVWINQAKADYEVKVVDTKPNDEILALVSGYLKLDGHASGDMVHFNEVSRAQIVALQNEGFTIRELASGSYAYDVVLPSGEGSKENIKEKLDALSKIQDNILWLSLENSGLSDEELKIISNFKNVQLLSIPKNDISDNGIKALSTLKALKSLNVYSTNVDYEGVSSLLTLPELKKIYVWKTGLDQKEITLLEEKHSDLKIVSGI